MHTREGRAPARPLSQPHAVCGRAGFARAVGVGLPERSEPAGAARGRARPSRAAHECAAQMTKSTNGQMQSKIANRKIENGWLVDGGWRPHLNLSTHHPSTSRPPARFPSSNFVRVGGAFFGGFPRTAKKLEKSSRNPLRRGGRFGILLTRCAEQGESPCGARRRSLKTDELKVKENCNVTR